MHAKEFQKLADSLAKGTGAAELRTAISRAYYAVYHVSVELLGEMSFQIHKNATGHREVLDHLSNSGDAEVQRASVQLGDLQGKRNRADYDLDVPDVENPNTARLTVTLAATLIHTLERCCSGPKRREIVQSIQRWKQRSSS